MSDLLDRYAAIVGEVVIDHLKQLARPLKGMKVVHINSTREGGGGCGRKFCYSGGW